MKAFEEWYNELPIKEDAEDQSLETQAKYKKGWEAALRWVMKIGMHYYGNDFLTDMGDLSKPIRDELKEEK